jgi:hypothetical protein
VSERTHPLSSRFLIDRGGINEAIPINAWTQIQFTAKRFDGLNEVLLAGAATRFTPIRTGYYLLHAQATWTGAVAINDVTGIMIRNLATAETWVDYFTADTTNEQNSRVTVIAYLVAGAPIACEVWNGAGVGLVLLGTAAQTYFCGHRLS